MQGSTAGGLVGWIAGSGPRLELEACVNYGSIGSNSTTGGMIGRGDTWGSPATLIFRSCSNSGRVEGKDGSVGFVGWTKMQAGSSLTFENCTNFGEIIGTVDAGGFIGAANNASDISAVLNDCRNYGGVTGTKFAGGMIGVTYHGSSSTAFTDCVNAGTVCSETANAGGLIGDGESANNTFTSCYNDLLERLMDCHLNRETAPGLYMEHASRLEELAGDPAFGYAFDTLSKLCRVVSLKCDMGWRLYQAYGAGDRTALAGIANREIPVLLTAAEEFLAAFRRQWYLENKTFGFVAHEIRLGGLMERIRSVGSRLNVYLNGEIDEIEELSLAPLPMSADSDGAYICYHNWHNIVAAGIL